MSSRGVPGRFPVGVLIFVSYSLLALVAGSLLYVAWLFVYWALSDPTSPWKDGEGEHYWDSGRIYLEQGWSEPQRQWFYFADQGSRLIPYRVFANIEQEKSQARFRELENLYGFGFLPAANNRYNPDGLPVGMLDGEGQLGLTCAACHTNDMRFGETLVRVDGAPALIDFWAFMTALHRSLKQHFEDPDKLERYLARLEIDAADAEAREEATRELKLATRRVARFEDRNYHDSGPGRLDAIGAIYNKALEQTGVVENELAADAPVSYPVLWDSSHHDYVQWNGSAPNKFAGALGRNIGQVFGVFGGFEPRSQGFGPLKLGYPSSVQTANLRSLEWSVRSLMSPHWSDLVARDLAPAVDESLRAQGEEIYVEKCAKCHSRLDRSDPDRFVNATLVSLGDVRTDPRAATNSARRAPTGRFAGKPLRYLFGRPIEMEAPTFNLLSHVVFGILADHRREAVAALLDNVWWCHDNRYQDRDKVGPDGKPLEGCDYDKGLDYSTVPIGEALYVENLATYKARPLNGIWASAPYLHNGSVPTLYHMLVPPCEGEGARRRRRAADAACRPSEFYVGSRRFDAKHVGFEHTQPGDRGVLFDTRLPGNSNAGHPFAFGLDEEERWELLEYLKTL